MVSLASVVRLMVAGHLEGASSRNLTSVCILVWPEHVGLFVDIKLTTESALMFSAIM